MTQDADQDDKNKQRTIDVMRKACDAVYTACVTRATDKLSDCYTEVEQGDGTGPNGETSTDECDATHLESVLRCKGEYEINKWVIDLIESEMRTSVLKQGPI